MIFSWNCYAIFHNFSVGKSIGWAIVAIIVNLAILYPLAGWAALLAETVTRKQGLAEKLVSKKIIWAFPLILLILFGARGCSSWKSALAQAVEQTIEEGSYYEVKKVVGIKKISKGVYSATAVLDNGHTLSVTVTEKDGDVYCEWR